MTLRCVIVDDNSAVLQAASDLLEAEGLAVVGVSVTTKEAVALLEELEPDVMLIDIDLGPESGFALACRLVQGDMPRPWIILMSLRDEADYAHQLARSPAIGFLSKSDLSARAIRALIERRGRR
jgi:DNA-binding NarL/FixJ family response regulator